MAREAQSQPLTRARVLALGTDWELADVVCSAGPDDRPFEERHRRVSIAAVIQGTFNYHSDRGRALLYPGALLLGNPGTCFECGHDHGVGDRCVALQVSVELFDEIAASAAGSSRFRFAHSMLPASAAVSSIVARIQSAAEAHSRPAIDESQIHDAVTAIVSIASGGVARRVSISARDAKRISDVVRHIEAHAADEINLDRLAAIARLSKFHFLRVFRAIVGLTPYQLLLDVRLRRAATRLSTSREPVSAIAYDAGFGDLSTFNRRFKTVFGQSPRDWRR